MGLGGLGLAANDVPGDVRAEVFRFDLPICGGFDTDSAICRNTTNTSDPLMHGGHADIKALG